MKNWTGNKNSIFTPLASSSHSEKKRQTEDFYATEPKAVELLLENETFSKNIWEPACGQGHISKVLKHHGYNVKSTDLIYRNYGVGGVDFLSIDNLEYNGNIITNPPYKYAKEFVLKSLQIIHQYCKVAMFLKIQFLESKDRKYLFQNFPPIKIYVASSRLICAKNAEFKKIKSSAVCYAWFVWEKGIYKKPVIDWIN